MSTAKGDSTQNRREGEAALTLIEFLVVLMILGTLAAVLVPKIIRWQREAALRGKEAARAELESAPWPRKKELIVAYPDLVNSRLADGATLLHRAVRGGDTGMVQLLLSKGADPDATDNYDFAPLHWASTEGRTKVGEVLLAGGADVNISGCKVDETPLHRATSEGHKDMVELLLGSGADVNARDKWRRTPLLWAARCGHKDVAELLLAEGAYVSAAAGWSASLHCSVEGWTPVHAACAEGHKHIVELLLSKGAKVNVEAYPDGTPLHMACLFGRTEVVELLLSAGAEVNARDSQGQTPLSLALERGHTETAELLKQHGAKEDAGSTPEESSEDQQTRGGQE